MKKLPAIYFQESHCASFFGDGYGSGNIHDTMHSSSIVLSDIYGYGDPYHPTPYEDSLIDPFSIPYYTERFGFGGGVDGNQNGDGGGHCMD